LARKARNPKLAAVRRSNRTPAMYHEPICRVKDCGRKALVTKVAGLASECKSFCTEHLDRTSPAIGLKHGDSLTPQQVAAILNSIRG